MNNSWTEDEGEIREQADQFEQAVELVYEVFGTSDAFRKWKDGHFGNRFNRAVYDIMIFYFWRPEISEDIQRQAPAVRQAFVELSESQPGFIDALESTTKSLAATFTRFSLWAETLNEVLEPDVPLPNPNWQQNSGRRLKTMPNSRRYWQLKSELTRLRQHFLPSQWDPTGLIQRA